MLVSVHREHMKLSSIFCLLVILITISSCNSYRTISSGRLTNGENYSVFVVDYFGKNCSDFFGSIQQKKVVIEQIVYNSCSSLPPVKIVFYYEGKKIASKEYFISITTANPIFPISEKEKQVMEIMSRRHSHHNYELYSTIKGFRKATENDNIFSVRSISQIDKRH